MTDTSTPTGAELARALAGLSSAIPFCVTCGGNGSNLHGVACLLCDGTGIDEERLRPDRLMARMARVRDILDPMRPGPPGESGWYEVEDQDLRGREAAIVPSHWDGYTLKGGGCTRSNWSIIVGPDGTTRPAKCRRLWLGGE